MTSDQGPCNEQGTNDLKQPICRYTYSINRYQNNFFALYSYLTSSNWLKFDQCLDSRSTVSFFIKETDQ